LHAAGLAIGGRCSRRRRARHVRVPPSVVDELGRGAGFGSVREVPIENPINRLYELRP
jgi:hypothetical protein